MAEWTIHDEKPDFRIEDDIGAVDAGPAPTIAVKSPVKDADEGPCLYLGPAGQRCYQRALKGGFCAEHQPGATARRGIGKRSKIVAAIVGIAGALWPYIYDFVRELMRILHPR
jgi:hypothetical protein